MTVVSVAMGSGPSVASAVPWHDPGMDLGLAGRVALVTGGSRGIGAGAAAALAAEGARVAVAARTRDSVQATAASLPGARGFVFDSDDLDAIGPLLHAVEAELGPVDVYVANTGGPPAGEDPLGFTREQWEAAHRSLVVSPMTIIERLAPGMRERGFGRVVAISSSAVREPIPSLQLSNAHRPGLIAAFKVLARRMAADGVTLNTILPGRIATERALSMAAGGESAAIPAGRLGTAEEIGAAVAFLCSAQAALRDRHDPAGRRRTHGLDVVFPRGRGAASDPGGRRVLMSAGGGRVP